VSIKNSINFFPAYRQAAKLLIICKLRSFLPAGLPAVGGQAGWSRDDLNREF